MITFGQRFMDTLLQEREKGTRDSVTTTSRSSNPNVRKNIVTIKRRYENQTPLKSGQSSLKDVLIGLVDSVINLCVFLDFLVLVIESKGLMRSPKSVTKSHESKMMTENNVSCFSPRSLASAFAQESGSAMFGYEGNCSSDQDLLLLDLPSNGSFPQAELLHQL